MPTELSRIARFRHAPARAMRRAGFRMGALVAGVLSIGFAAGQAGAQSGERYYQVEVVIFSQPAGSSAEQRPLQRVPEVETELEPAQGTAPTAGSPVAPRKLDAVARRLNTGGFTLLWHQAWVQPAVAGGGLELATLAALGQGPAATELSGIIGLTAGRFLHLGIAIELHSAAGPEAVLAQRRTVRPGVEQYFDHPHIGVIALVTPVTLKPAARQPAP